jgi:hypothetical protein
MMEILKYYISIQNLIKENNSDLTIEVGAIVIMVNKNGKTIYSSNDIFHIHIFVAGYIQAIQDQQQR